MAMTTSARASRVLHRRLDTVPPLAVRAEGLWIYDAQGRGYLDACGGAAVSCLGHRHPEVLEAMRRQLDALDYAHTGFFTSEAAEALADELVAHAPPGLGHVHFAGSGSEAVETALKLARQHALETGQPQRRHLVAHQQSYHGNTLGALSVGGHAGRRAQYAPLLLPVHHAEACYDYRGRQPGESPEAYGERLAAGVEALVERLGPQEVLAFVCETVGGATAGALEPPPGYLRRVRELCTRHGILLVLDEVMCGLGRTGWLHACEAEGVAPDLLPLAKGLGGGHVPIGAVLVGDGIHRAFAGGSRTVQHGHTYLGHPLACAAALAVQQVIRRDGLVARVREAGLHLRKGLVQQLGDHPRVGDIRGRGLLQAIEVVQDRATREPFEPALDVAGRIQRAALAQGLLVYPGRGTADGRRGDHVLLAPPFITPDATLDEIVGRLAVAVAAALEGLPASRGERP
jgi:adenosylmethionine-8-amino-7-oxononanoate aminotransferase